MGFFNCVRRVGVMPTSMRRNYATPASMRRHFDITCLLGGWASLVVWDHCSCKILRCPPSGSVSSRLTSKWNVPYLYIDRTAFPFPKNTLQFIAEIMHLIGYRKVMQNESSFFFFFFFTTCPIPPLHCHTGRFCILGLCTLVSIFLLLIMAF